jgi:cytochrome c oxidase subunit 4
MKTDEKEFHGLKDRTYVLVWIGLVILTGVTVSAAGRDLGALSISIALIIAGVKSGLVLGYFMHLKYEKELVFKLIIPGILALLLLFIGIVFTDVAFR